MTLDIDARSRIAPPAPVIPARRTANIRYAVRDVVLLAQEAAATGREMLYLNIGDPNLFGFAPPEHLVEAVHEAMRRNRNGYAPSSGVPEALEAVAREADAKGIMGIRHIFITTGASEAIDLALSAVADPGDNVLTPSPGYPLYTAVLARLGIENRTYALDEAAEWQPDVEDVAARINGRTRAIVVINPNNPTGSVASAETMGALLDVAVENDVVVFSDEIYDKLLLDGRVPTATASLRDNAKVVTFNGLSKSYVVPGWRIGWGIVSGPEGVMDDYCEAIQKMERARLSANHPEQYAIRPALEGSQAHLGPMTEVLTRRRDITVRRLNAIDGISCVPPAGAFYAFPRIDLGVADQEFVRRAIRDTGVVIVPGSGFGQMPGSNHFRVVFLPPEEVLERAFDGIAEVAASCRS
ncbi:MAG: pyridoxal phosphate-dependent aminotransferase [Anaerolineae bacterium]